MDIIKLLLILNFIFEHFTILKQIDSMGAHTSRFGTRNNFLTFHRFETIMLLEYLHDLVAKLLNRII